MNIYKLYSKEHCIYIHIYKKVFLIIECSALLFCCSQNEWNSKLKNTSAVRKLFFRTKA